MKIENQNDQLKNLLNDFENKTKINQLMVKRIREDKTELEEEIERLKGILSQKTK